MWVDQQIYRVIIFEYDSYYANKMSRYKNKIESQPLKKCDLVSFQL